MKAEALAPSAMPPSWKSMRDDRQRDMANGHGGRRPGAGRKRGGAAQKHSRSIVLEVIERGETPLQYFMSIMNDQTVPIERRDWAASQAAPYWPGNSRLLRDHRNKAGQELVLQKRRITDPIGGMASLPKVDASPRV